MSTSLAFGKSFSLSMLEFPHLLNKLQQDMDLYELEWNRIELEGIRLRMQCWTISSCNTPAKQGTAKTSPCCHHFWTLATVCPGSHPQKSKPCQEYLVCPCPGHQGIERGNLLGQEKGLCLLLNLGLSPSRKTTGWRAARTGVSLTMSFTSFSKGPWPLTLLPENIVNHCIGLSLITALKLYDSKY